MKAYDVGFKEASEGKPHKRFRAYETDKANNAYFQGYADGLAKRHPGHRIVKCNRDGTIFAVDRDKDPITCPTCGRGYILDENGIFMSDRPLTILG
jgi:hypothetical protein